jgi:hypothetical protein
MSPLKVDRSNLACTGAVSSSSTRPLWLSNSKLPSRESAPRNVTEPETVSNVPSRKLPPSTSTSPLTELARISAPSTPETRTSPLTAASDRSLLEPW